MTIRLRPETERDIVEAVQWYEHREAGLGRAVMDEIEAAFAEGDAGSTSDCLPSPCWRPRDRCGPQASLRTVLLTDDLVKIRNTRLAIAVMASKKACHIDCAHSYRQTRGANT